MRERKKENKERRRMKMEEKQEEEEEEDTSADFLAAIESVLGDLRGIGDREHLRTLNELGTYLQNTSATSDKERKEIRRIGREEKGEEKGNTSIVRGVSSKAEVIGGI